MKKQRVLIFIDWFKPGYKAGGPTTSNVNIVDHLSDKFDFYVITSDTDYHATEPYPDVDSDKWLDRGNCHIWYFSKNNLSLSTMRKAVKEACCPVWYVNGIYSRYFSLYPLILAKQIKPEKLIVSARGMLSPHAISVKPFSKRTYLMGLKFLGLYDNAIFHGTNEVECSHIRARIFNSSQCVAIENLPRKLFSSFSPSSKAEKAIRLVSFARISSEKNTLYAIKTLAGCSGKIEYDLFGQINSDEYWKECLLAINSLPANVTVRYKGSINPSMLGEIYKQYDALYLPTTGENFGHAILESFMNSRPVIISDRTPWQNLTAKNIGYDIPLDRQEDFAITIDQLADAPAEKFNEMCLDSYNFAKHICENHEVIAKYQSMFSI